MSASLPRKISKPSGFQACPVCDGTGNDKGHLVPRDTPKGSMIFPFKTVYGKCIVCQGKLIINKRTGRPPKTRARKKGSK